MSPAQEYLLNFTCHARLTVPLSWQHLSEAWQTVWIYFRIAQLPDAAPLQFSGYVSLISKSTTKIPNAESVHGLACN